MKNFKKKLKIIRLMEWWKNMIFPFKSLCFHAKDRRHRQTAGGGLLKLSDDIQTCGYEDVQVMWEMLRKSETEVKDKKGVKRNLKQWPSWRMSEDDMKSVLA